jgi:hypothetical protein
MWKSVNFILASSYVIYPTVQRRIRTSKHSTLGSDSTLQLFGFSSAVWYKTVIPENWPQDATRTLTLSSPGRSLYTSVIWKVTAGRN